jgi:hypothetical protein
LLFHNNYFNEYCLKCGNKYEEYSNYCRSCLVSYIENDFSNWTSGNEKIDDFIQKIQLKISNKNDTIFGWIPYNKFIDINEIGKSGFATAIWKDGPLYYSYINKKFKKKFSEKVLLKYLYNSQNINNKFINEV